MNARQFVADLAPLSSQSSKRTPLSSSVSFLNGISVSDEECIPQSMLNELGRLAVRIAHSCRPASSHDCRSPKEIAETGRTQRKYMAQAMRVMEESWTASASESQKRSYAWSIGSSIGSPDVSPKLSPAAVGIAGSGSACARQLGLHGISLAPLSPQSPQRPRCPSKARNADASPEMARQLLQAVSLGDVLTVQQLLSDGPADPDALADPAGPALLLAAEGGHLEIVEALIAAGADVNLPRGGLVPAYVAYRHGHEDVVRVLLGAAFDALSDSFSNPVPETPLGSSLSFLTGLSVGDEDGMPESMIHELGRIAVRIARSCRPPEHKEMLRSPKAISEAGRMRKKYVVQAMRMLEENAKASSDLSLSLSEN